MTAGNGIILVSGGARGIGRAIIEVFASRGFHVATFSRSKEELKELQQEISKRYEVDVISGVVDISKKEEVKAFAQKLLALNYQVEILVNNAGFFMPGSISGEEEGTLERTMETNVYGTYYLTREILPDMRKRGRGHIFNICSIASKVAYPNGGSYCMSKFAMLGFSKVLREETKEEGIRVTAVLPGATYTKSWEGSGLPESRFIKPEDVAKAVLSAWELSDSAVMEEVVIRPQKGDI